jgi:hypothetical protein
MRHQRSINDDKPFYSTDTGATIVPCGRRFAARLFDIPLQRLEINPMVNDENISTRSRSSKTENAVVGLKPGLSLGRNRFGEVGQRDVRTICERDGRGTANGNIRWNSGPSHESE